MDCFYEHVGSGGIRVSLDNENDNKWHTIFIVNSAMLQHTSLKTRAIMFRQQTKICFFLFAKLKDDNEEN